jgi:hypothetical protein
VLAKALEVAPERIVLARTFRRGDGTGRWAGTRAHFGRFYA